MAFVNDPEGMTAVALASTEVDNDPVGLARINALSRLTLRSLYRENDHALRCPYRGIVSRERLPTEEAERRITEASIERTKRRNLNEPSPISPAEISMLAGLLFYGENPLLQHPVGPYDLDFLIADYKAAIEVDGREWHDRIKDAQRDRRVLKIAGIHTYRVAASDALKDPLRAVRNVCRDIIERRRETPCHTS